MKPELVVTAINPTAAEESKVTAPVAPGGVIENSPVCGKVARTCVLRPLMAMDAVLQGSEDIAERYRH